MRSALVLGALLLSSCATWNKIEAHARAPRSRQMRELDAYVQGERDRIELSGADGDDAREFEALHLDLEDARMRKNLALPAAVWTSAGCPDIRDINDDPTVLELLRKE